MTNSGKIKKIVKTRPVLTLSFLLTLFYACPFVVSLLMGYQTGAGYVSALLLLFLTWLLYRWEGSDLSKLGLTVKAGNVNFLLLGVITGILFFTGLFFAQMLFNGIHLQVNKRMDYLLIVKGVFLLLSWVFTEELIFRGYCFIKTIEQANVLKANLIFAFLFIVWHWIAFSAWGKYGIMLGLITTGFGHWLFSAALLKSGTLYFPIGIHLGNNWASHNLFSSSTGGLNTKPSNDVFFVVITPLQAPSQFDIIAGYLITFAYFSIFTWIIWRWQKKPFKL